MIINNENENDNENENEDGIRVEGRKNKVYYQSNLNP